MDDRRRRERRAELYALLGDLPARDRPISVLSQHDVTGTAPYSIERLVLDLNGVEPVPAYFLKPRGAPGRLPVVLYNHWHGGNYDVGKDEVLKGKRGQQRPPYGYVLTGMGCAVLAIDHWGFGERFTRSESDLFKHFLWHGQVMWGMMVYDSLRAIDYLATRDDVDLARLATIGMSMGSTMAQWVAALDERVKVCVDVCCLTDYQALIEAGNLKGHGLYYFVPGLLKHFTAAQVNELIVPRPHLGLAGNRDSLTPPAGLDRIDAGLKRSYADAGRPECWKLHREDVGHEETPEMRRQMEGWLNRWL